MKYKIEDLIVLRFDSSTGSTRVSPAGNRITGLSINPDQGTWLFEKEWSSSSHISRRLPIGEADDGGGEYGDFIVGVFSIRKMRHMETLVYYAQRVPQRVANRNVLSV